ncbi:hypothetical protein [Saccharomonospora sp. NB11]|uniref:hypothetical protein n=1 Tax=Saccharomonospora sp. NB11 TaxID=1642298 RepID=UPI0018D1EA02|nr:hypothetical protein [Saccharomonospora sp. NB11]
MSTSDPNGTGDDLDARLHALFADPRLDVVPAPRVGEQIVAGARRRRRRRVVLTGSGTTLAVVAATVALVTAGSASDERQNDYNVAVSPPEAPPVDASTLHTPHPEHPDGPPPQAEPVPDGPSAATPSAEVSSAVVPPPSATMETGRILVADAVLAADGYRQLKLGMPYREAVATELLVVSADAPPPSVCADYSLTEGDSSVSAVTISREYGIVGFTANNAVTPEGAGIGTPVGDLETLYPEGRSVDRTYVVDTGEGVYEFTAVDGFVDTLALKAHTYDC